MAEPIPEKEIEGAYELPEGWAWAALSEICKPKITKDPKKNESGEFIYLDIESIDNEIQTIVRPRRLNNKNAPSRAKRLVKSGDVIISLVRPYLKNIALIPEDLDNSIASTAFYPLKPESGIDSNYLFHIVRRQSFIDSIVTYGDSPPSARDNEFIQIQIPLPPLAEQRRITAKLEALLAQVNAAKDHLAAVPPLIKRFRQSVLAAACSGRLTEGWRREHPDVEPASELLKRIREERIRRSEDEFQKPKAEGRRKPKNIEPHGVETEGLPELPEGWEWTNLGLIIDSMKNGLYKPIEYYGSGVPCLRMYNIEDGRIVWKDLKKMKLTKEEINKYKLLQNDLLVNRVNSRELVGKTAIFPPEIGDVVYESKNIRLRVIEIAAFPKYLNYLFMTRIVRDQIELKAKQTVGMATISQSQIENWIIPIPPLFEQRIIAEHVETLFHCTSKVEERVTAATAHADRLTQSILAKAFRGELVPQDLDDEPASVLLERIRKERTELKKKKKPQKRRSKTLSDSN